MNFLLIDATTDKICFFSQFNNFSYNKTFESNKKNYDQFSTLLFSFLKKNNIDLNLINHLFINQGPGNFSGLRVSIAVAKGLSITKKLDLYGFNSKDIKNVKYLDIISLFKKEIFKKNLIKPIYLS